MWDGLQFCSCDCGSVSSGGAAFDCAARVAACRSTCVCTRVVSFRHFTLRRGRSGAEEAPRRPSTAVSHQHRGEPLPNSGFAVPGKFCIRSLMVRCGCLMCWPITVAARGVVTIGVARYRRCEFPGRSSSLFSTAHRRLRNSASGQKLGRL